MKMYCSRCGTGEQAAETYCRSCGHFLHDHRGRSLLVNKLFGGSAPSTQVTVNLALNLVTIFTSFLLIGFLNGYYDALRDRTGEEAPSVIYFVYAFLLAISGWQILSLIVGARLRTRLRRNKKGNNDQDAAGEFGKQTITAKTQTLLPDADEVGTKSLSVTEDSTRHLRPTQVKRS